MKVFITGASGYIGFSVARAYRQAGHEVYGLIRREEAVPQLEREEIIPVLGNLDRPDSYRAIAMECTLFIHTALEASERGYALERQTIQVVQEMGEQGAQNKMLIYTSGVWVYGDTGHQFVDESSPLNPPVLVAERVEIENMVLESDRVRGLVIRPACVYGGRGGLTGMWFQSAEQGQITAIGNGDNHWTMVHVEDLARAYLAAGEVGYYGEVLNVSDHSRLTVKEMVEAVRQVTGSQGEPAFVPVEEASKQMGPFAECLALDQHVDSFKARTILNWQPTHRNFVDDVERYYRSWKQHLAARS